jgi:two-component system chemotaxis sensor kinase CheA
MARARNDRLRDLFAQESEVRLARLSRLLLRADDLPDADTLGEIFREVHTLKGSAAVVGFEELSTYAHDVEERLDRLRRGDGGLTPEIVDDLLAAVDQLTTLTTASLLGQDVVAPVSPGPSAPVAIDGGAGAASRSAILVPVDRLDELVRTVGEAAAANLRVGRMVQERLGVAPSRVSELVNLSRLLNELQDKAMRTQMVPVATVTDRLHRAVRDLSRSLDKDVRWEVRGEQTELERNVLDRLSDLLVHVVRNAVDHGIEVAPERAAAGKPPYGTIRLQASQLGSEVIIEVTDDGRGIDVAALRETARARGVDTEPLSDPEALQLVFHSGFSTAQALSEISGRGIGLDAVRAGVEALRGRAVIESEAGRGTVLRLVVPITLAVLPCLLVDAAGQTFAIPLHRVVVVQAAYVATFHGEGRVVLWIDDEPVPVTALADVLGLPDADAPSGPIVVVRGALQLHGFQVDALAGHRDAVVKGLSDVLPRIDVVAGTSIDPEGAVIVVLDPPGLVARARHTMSRRHVGGPVPGQSEQRMRILVVDDALTVRELQRSILLRAGYDVSVAVDGADALAFLESSDVDLVLTDVQMPRMDGLTLTRAIREHRDLANLPVVIVTTLDSDDQRRQGLDAGADAYVVKSDFSEQALLEVVGRILGGRGTP